MCQNVQVTPGVKSGAQRIVNDSPSVKEQIYKIHEPGYVNQQTFDDSARAHTNWISIR